MGQRTQMVVEVTKCEQKYTASYYNQWGIGKMQLLDVMRFVTTYHNEKWCRNDYIFPETLYNAFLLKDDVFKGEATSERVIDWLNTQDNNNGGILLKIKVNDYNDIESGELYIFNDPEATDTKGKVKKYIDLFEYVNYNPQYFNEPFLTAFTALMRFYNIEIKSHVD